MKLPPGAGTKVGVSRFLPKRVQPPKKLQFGKEGTGDKVVGFLVGERVGWVGFLVGDLDVVGLLVVGLVGFLVGARNVGLVGFLVGLLVVGESVVAKEQVPSPETTEVTHICV